MTGFDAVAVAVGAMACATDVRARRVPNWLTGSAAVAALLAHSLAPGGSGALGAALGLLVGLLVFFPFFALGGMGGGDVKLMAALGAWAGWHTVIWTALYGAVAGGALALVVALGHGYLRQALSNIGGLLLFWSVQGVRPMPALTLEHGHGPRMPYAIPIFIGLMVALWRQ